MHWSYWLSTIPSILAAIATLALAIGVFFAYRHYRQVERDNREQIRSSRKQLQQMKHSTNAQLAMDLFWDYASKTKVEMLQWIYNTKPPITAKMIQELDSNSDLVLDKYELDRVLNQLDMLGALVQYEVIDEDLAIDGYAGATVLRCWYQLHEYIKSERQEKRGSTYLEHLEDLVTRTIKYAKIKHPEGNWICFRPGRARDMIDLVQKIYETPDLRPSGLEDG